MKISRKGLNKLKKDEAFSNLHTCKCDYETVKMLFDKYVLKFETLTFLKGDDNNYYLIHNDIYDVSDPERAVTTPSGLMRKYPMIMRDYIKKVYFDETFFNRYLNNHPEVPEIVERTKEILDLIDDWQYAWVDTRVRPLYLGDEEISNRILPDLVVDPNKVTGLFRLYTDWRSGGYGKSDMTIQLSKDDVRIVMTVEALHAIVSNFDIKQIMILHGYPTEDDYCELEYDCRIHSLTNFGARVKYDVILSTVRECNTSEEYFGLNTLTFLINALSKHYHTWLVFRK